jgi:uncharacterized protein
VFSDDLILPMLERLRGVVPDLAFTDVHTHIGSNDPDGFRCSPEQLLKALAAADARGVVFPMHEPDGYRSANDRVLVEAAASDGRLTAFCRVDPRDEPVAEAERCLEAGARGIKLHPRAEQFTLDLPPVAEILALAQARSLPVLVHAGRGIPALGRHAVDLCQRFPQARLILAHAGICDLAWIWRDAAELPNLFFDTAWWSPSDLLTLFACVPPGQILFGSDAPYGTPAFAATMATRCALQAGLGPEEIRTIASTQTERLVDGEEPLDLGAAPGPDALPSDPLLDRVYAFLLSSIGQMFHGIDPEETLALAALCCEVGDDAPQAEVCRLVLALIEERNRHRTDPPPENRPRRFASGLPLIVVAAGVVRTPDVPLPTDLAAADVGERERA